MILQLIPTAGAWIAEIEKAQLITELPIVAFALVEEGVPTTRSVVPIAIHPTTKLPEDLRAIATASASTIRELRQRPS